ncbi:PEP/pyruvate-binding domain-containing protein [Rhodococcus sp. P1Y]|uniref:PEP/pyruvate-binding domain-containing protein n=1 Tax=Rhodococcus sp. P1Y TaxID=1302308 RepID=UPI000EADED84|nr:PEP/pyruvate-binding domain-containing protein [Rhodococcus sp. P1Y]AYJ47362.1 hypothetical protein D8W71_02240 [Rhodococcus sp. P1Y]
MIPINHTAASRGGKALGLDSCVKVGLNVPPYVVVTSDYFSEHIDAAQVRPLLAQLDRELRKEPAPPLDYLAPLCQEIRHRITSADAPRRLRATLGDARGELGPGAMAIRSSMVGEDSAQKSYAGQLESFLNVLGLDECVRCVLACWASAFQPHTVLYMHSAGARVEDTSVAVVVQQMIDATKSGVAFSADPVSGVRETVVVSAAWGLGEGVVSGGVDADEYRFTRDGQPRGQTLTHQEAMVVSDLDGGTKLSAVPKEQADSAVLSADDGARICAITVRAEKWFGVPVDVEWTIAEGVLYVLQARPITGLPPAPPVRQSLSHRSFDNSNIQESFNGYTSPLTFSFASLAYERVFTDFAQAVGVAPGELATFKPYARNMLGYLNGRVYYNLQSWYAMLGLLPGYETNKEETERVMWHLEEPADESESRAASQGLLRRARLFKVGVRIAANFATLDLSVARFVRNFDRVYTQIDRPALATQSIDELNKAISIVHREMMDSWQVPNVNDLRVMMTCGAIRRITAELDGDTADSVFADLMSNIEGIESIQPTLLLAEIADCIGRDGALRTLVLDTEQSTVDVYERLTASDSSVAQRLQDYVSRYGDRSAGELKLETQTIRDQPHTLVPLLRNLVAHSDIVAERLTNRPATAFRKARRDTAARLGPLRRIYFRAIVSWARKSVADREKLRLLRTYAFGATRDIYRAYGMRLHELGALDSPEDIYMLTVDEIDAYVSGRAVSSDLDSLVATRRLEHKSYLDVDMANRIDVEGLPYQQVGAVVSSPENHTAEKMKGLGCAPGVVRAKVVVVESPTDAVAVAGKIICAMRTDPGWAPLFPTAAGLIVERGSSLSHSAVVAREIGLPTVVGVPGVTRWLCTGDEVLLDGERGTIERLPRDPANEGGDAA